MWSHSEQACPLTPQNGAFEVPEASAWPNSMGWLSVQRQLRELTIANDEHAIELVIAVCRGRR
jgi:hypothetical protein